MKKSTLFAAALAALAGAALCAPAGAQLMYSFEGDLQGFGPNGGGTTLTLDTIGATQGTGSLKFSQVAGATFTAGITGNITPEIGPNLSAIQLDVTVVQGQEFPGGFANLGVTIWGASQPGPGQTFGNQYQTTGTSEKSVKLAAGTHTLLIPIVGTNPFTFATNQTPQQVIGNGPDQLIPTHFQFYVNKSGTDPLTIYIDNIQAILIPEPASALGAGAAAAGGLLVRRRRRA